TRLGCGSCDDYLGESADLAVGALGAGDDAATLIIRTPAGDAFVRNARLWARLETSHAGDPGARAAAAGAKDRRERAQAFQDMRVLMLDALAEPLKRGEAIQQFTRLYRTPSRAAGTNRPRNGCTGC
ncbi:MAG: Coenzyme F420 hydrogenase/dehydrogenase, beta subunit C-terminal domain, partial [Anaerolineales bacterium]|nr:Coenzyme F420 hydrogenase/dehydrogenase, beta subunit C-terminal domain [Anaerolineales bacterium]